MSTKRRKRHTPERIVRKLRDADSMLNAGKELAVVLQTLEVSESTYERWRKHYGGMKCEEAKRMKELEEVNKRLKETGPIPSTSRLKSISVESHRISLLDPAEQNCLVNSQCGRMISPCVTSSQSISVDRPL